MAWEASHAIYAWTSLRDKLESDPDITLAWLWIAYAENEAARYPRDEDTGEPITWREPDLNQKRYRRARRHAQKMTREALAEYLYDAAERINTTDNGGFNVWVCPWGCHTVAW